jgi:hypothetical protein
MTSGCLQQWKILFITEYFHVNQQYLVPFTSGINILLRNAKVKSSQHEKKNAKMCGTPWRLHWKIISLISVQ